MAIKVGGVEVVSNARKVTAANLEVGDVVYANSKGTAGQVLTMNGGASEAVFADLNIPPSVDATSGGDGIKITVASGKPTIDVDLSSSDNGLYFNSEKLDISLSSKSAKGVVQIGDGIDVTAGVISVKANVVSVTGGNGINVTDVDGVVGVSVDLTSSDSGLHIDGSKKLNIYKASDTQFGTIKVGDGLKINSASGALESELKNLDALTFLGEVDLTSDGTGGDSTDSLPANPSRGDTYVNTGSGSLGSLWGSEISAGVDVISDPPTDVQAGDLVVFDGTQYVYIPTGGAVVTYGAGHGLKLNSSTEPQVFSVDDTLIKVTFVGDTTPTDTSTHSVTNGDLWWNSADGILYIYYNDGSSEQWVVASPQAPQITDYTQLTNKPTIGNGTITIKDSDGGDVGNFTVNQEGSTEITLPAPPDVSVVTISDSAPLNPSAEDLWWNSSDGMMYIYYNDGSSEQWVISSPTVKSSRVKDLEDAMSELYQDAVSATDFDSLRSALINALSEFA